MPAPAPRLALGVPRLAARPLRVARGSTSLLAPRRRAAAVAPRLAVGRGGGGRRDGGGFGGGGSGGGGNGGGGASGGGRGPATGPVLVLLCSAASLLAPSRANAAPRAPADARANEVAPQVAVATETPADAAWRALEGCLHEVKRYMFLFAFACFGVIFTSSRMNFALDAALKRSNSLVVTVFGVAGWLLTTYLDNVNKRFDRSDARMQGVEKQLKTITDLLTARRE